MRMFMAKKRPQPVSLETSDAVDDYMESVLDKAREEYGDERVYTGDEAEKRVVVLPLPALSLRYLYQANGQALGRMTMVYGQEGSCKSAYLYEGIRWHRCLRGKGYLFENESKDSPALRTAINNYDRKACEVLVCEALEDWQEGLSKYLDFLQTLMEKGDDKRPAMGRTIPVILGIDSLTGKASRDSQATINKQGFASREHPVEALIISRYMKTVPQRIAQWPFSIWGTNHLKPSQDFMGRPVDNVGGGMSLKFQETYGIKMQRTGDIEKADSAGISTKITMHKNSMGQSRKSIQADLKWHWEEDEVTGERRQVVYWDWYSASIAKLLEFPQKGSVGSKIHEIVDLHPGTAKMVWSDALGIPKDDPQDFEEAGRALEVFLTANPQVEKALYPLLGIGIYPVFRPGVDLREQLKEAMAGTVESADAAD